MIVPKTRSYIQSEKAMKRAKKFQVQLQTSESKQNKGLYSCNSQAHHILPRRDDQDCFRRSKTLNIFINSRQTKIFLRNKHKSIFGIQKCHVKLQDMISQQEEYASIPPRIKSRAYKLKKLIVVAPESKTQHHNSQCPQNTDHYSNKMNDFSLK